MPERPSTGVPHAVLFATMVPTDIATIATLW